MIAAGKYPFDPPTHIYNFIMSEQHYASVPVVSLCDSNFVF